MSELNRRGFFHRTALGTLGAAAGLGVASAISLASLRPASAQTPAKRVGGPKLKLSLNAYSLRQALERPSPRPRKRPDAPRPPRFLRQHDFEAIDPTGYYFPGYGSVRLGNKGEADRRLHPRFQAPRLRTGGCHQRHGRGQRPRHAGQGEAGCRREAHQGLGRSRGQARCAGAPRLLRSGSRGL